MELTFHKKKEGASKLRTIVHKWEGRDSTKKLRKLYFHVLNGSSPLAFNCASTYLNVMYAGEIFNDYWAWRMMQRNIKFI